MGKAIYVTFDKLDPNSGAGLVCLHEINALKKVINNLVVIERKDILGADMYDFNPFLYDYFASLVVPSDNVDILHLSCSPANAILRAVRAHHYVVNIVAHDLQVSIDEHELYHGKGSYPFKHNTNEYLHSLLLKHTDNADMILTPSSSSAKWINSNLSNHNVTIIPHGTEIPEKVEPLPSQLSFGYMGAFGPDKGLIYLFDAWNRRESLDDILVFAGSCCNAIQGTGTIKMLGWVNNISEFYNQISVYIQPSVTEGFGIEIIEAMAYGRPVIVSSGTGGADAVQDGINGFVVPPRDSDAIRSKIKWFNDNPQMIVEMGNKARETAQQYSWDKIENRYVEFYIKIGGLS